MDWKGQGEDSLKNIYLCENMCMFLFFVYYLSTSCVISYYIVLWGFIFSGQEVSSTIIIK